MMMMKATYPEQNKTTKQEKRAKRKAQEVHIDTRVHAKITHTHTQKKPHKT